MYELVLTCIEYGPPFALWSSLKRHGREIRNDLRWLRKFLREEVKDIESDIWYGWMQIKAYYTEMYSVSGESDLPVYAGHHRRYQEVDWDDPL
jgi:hypothetical protein